MTTFSTLAISLKATPFKETDQVVAFYSAEHGELRAIAKGVKKPTSKLAGSCEPLTLNQIYLAKGKNLHTVCHYERVESFSNLRQDLERLAVGTTCTDVVRFLGRENDPDSQMVYHLLAQTLTQLDNLQVPWIQTSLEYHLHMLRLAGYLPVFTHCVTCHEGLAVETAPHFPFSLELGGFLCATCEVIHQQMKLVNTSAKTMQLFQAPNNEAFYENAFKAHRFLAYYWSHRLERELKSFSFLLRLLQPQTAALL